MNPEEYRRMFDAEGSLWWYVGLHELILGIVGEETATRGGRLAIFDAGCGTGQLALLMTRFGDVDGCDASELAIGFCRRRGLDALTVADLGRMRLEPGRYDVITSIDVLYHRDIGDDMAVLERLYAALKPGGLLIVHLPAFEWLRSTHDVAVRTRERYRKETLVPRLSQAGFTVSFVSYRIFLLFPVVAIVRLASRILTRRGGTEVASDVHPVAPWLNRILLAIVRVENHLLRRGVALPIGLSLLAIARKPAGPEAGRR
jgi:SAM-dependent methyltransferase